MAANKKAAPGTNRAASNNIFASHHITVSVVHSGFRHRIKCATSSRARAIVDQSDLEAVLATAPAWLLNEIEILRYKRDFKVAAAKNPDDPTDLAAKIDRTQRHYRLRPRWLQAALAVEELAELRGRANA